MLKSKKNQMVRWNRIMPLEEVYDKLAIYWFPERHKSIEEFLKKDLCFGRTFAWMISS